MLFSQAFRTLGSRFPFAKRLMSAETKLEESSGLVLAMGTTFCTYMLADFLSNFIQHPSQKMDYGIFNKAIGRSMDQAWWGTRTQHIVGVAATLTITDYASQSIFAKSLGRPLCFAKSPATFVAHTFLFIFTGVTLYVGLDACFNPILQGRRLEAFKEGTYCSYVGSNTAWFEPYVPVAVARYAGVAAGSSWAGGALLPATLAYSTVKGVGWTDFGNHGLNDHEMRLNGLGLNKE